MEIKFINSGFRFTLFPNVRSVDTPSGDIDVNQLIEAIRHGYYREIVERLRNTNSKEDYKQIKINMIPCVSLSGIFNYRNRKGLIKHSGLMQIDLDKGEICDDLFDKICDDSYTYVCFKSPGGHGLKAIVKVYPSDETHLHQFLALELYYKSQYGVIIDRQVKDIARALLLSFDPDIYCNPWSNVFDEMYIPESYSRNDLKIPKKAIKQKNKYSENPSEAIERLISSLGENNIDITNSYDNWIKVGLGLSETFGEAGREYFHKISRKHPNYTFKETELTYTQLLSKNDGRITLGSIIHIAKEAKVSW